MPKQKIGKDGFTKLRFSGPAISLLFLMIVAFLFPFLPFKNTTEKIIFVLILGLGIYFIERKYYPMHRLEYRQDLIAFIFGFFTLFAALAIVILFGYLAKSLKF